MCFPQIPVFLAPQRCIVTMTLGRTIHSNSFAKHCNRRQYISRGLCLLLGTNARSWSVDQPKMNLGRLFSASLNASTRAISIGGHRGCGENLLSSTQTVEPVYRENTIASFKRAAALGVSFVEFDVQVTSDGVPIIWHDDEIITRSSSTAAVSECQVKDKSLKEFTALVHPSQGGWQTDVVRKFRNRETRQHIDGLSAWSCAQDDKLPTLQRLFQELPESLGFDIEVKMAVPDTVHYTPAEEIERMVSPILKVVEECTANSNRTVMFSSFDPDICIELAKRQKRFPVMFLSGCGLYPHVDPRRTAVASALEFASSQNLAGIVVPASVVVAYSDLVKNASEKGMKVLTYGLENNDVLIVQRQAELGVHAAIVDDVESTLPQLTSLVPTTNLELPTPPTANLEVMVPQ